MIFKIKMEIKHLIIKKAQATSEKNGRALDCYKIKIISY